MSTNKIDIDVTLARKLIDKQFPQWAHLLIKPIQHSGWDNRTFHLGEHMSIRLPSAAEYASQVEKEHDWLPKLAPILPLQIPVPITMGKPQEEYPWHWSIYQWLEGETASMDCIDDVCEFASKLAEFLIALQQIDTTGGPLTGSHNFYRGGPLKTYDAETRRAIEVPSNELDATLVTKIWNTALASTWQNDPVWIHGDVAVGNLLVNDGKLSAVIDFGQLGIGDPACDLVIAWTFFKGKSREVFRKTLKQDNATWQRARGWALWKALITCTKFSGTNNCEVEKSRSVIDEVVVDYK